MIGRRAIVVALAAAACTDPLPLDTTAQPLASVSPTTWDFGGVPLGTESAPRPIAVAPAPDDNLDTVAGIVLDCPGFRFDLRGAELPFRVSRTCEGDPPCATEAYDALIFDAYFQPTSAGLQSCPLLIDLAEPAADRLIELRGTGVPPPVELAIAEPTSFEIDFGDIPTLVQSAPVPVTIRSDGSGPLQIVSAMLVGAGSVFAQNPASSPASVPPGTSAVYDLRCTPVGGPNTTTFQIATDDPDEGTVLVGLRCNGVVGLARFNPAPAVFPIARIGEIAMLTVAFQNTSTVAMNVTGTAIEGDGFGIMTPPTLGSLAPGTSTNIGLNFTPTADGDITGRLDVMYDGVTRSVALIGRGREALLAITPGALVEFGPICATQTATQDVVAVATSSAPVSIIGASADNPELVVMPLAPPAFPATLAPEGTIPATIQVAATPTAVGDVSGTLTVMTDIPAMPMRTVPVHAVALGPGTTATPTALDVGAVPVDVTTGAREVTLSNCEPDPLTIAADSNIEGPNAAEFFLTPPPALDVPAGTSARFGVALTPTSIGAKQATLHIIHSRGTIDIPLTGEGLDPSGSFDDDGRGSYYACRAGGEPGGLALVALAIALAGRGRGRGRTSTISATRTR